MELGIRLNFVKTSEFRGGGGGWSPPLGAPLHTGGSLGPEPNDFETKFAADKFKRYKSPGILMKSWQNWYNEEVGETCLAVPSQQDQPPFPMAVHLRYNTSIVVVDLWSAAVTVL
jgi:hypothetical protein